MFELVLSLQSLAIQLFQADHYVLDCNNTGMLCQNVDTTHRTKLKTLKWDDKAQFIWTDKAKQEDAQPIGG